MRIAFTGNPMTGHLLPMMPLLDAARAAGHEAVVITAEEMEPRLAPAAVWPAGPGVAANVEETLRRTGSHPAHPGPGTVEYFAGVRVDLAVEETLEQLVKLEPDLLVTEELDYLGPLVATMLDIPWVEHRVGAPLPEDFTSSLRDRSAKNFAERSLRPSARIALVDAYPDFLLGPDDHRAADRISLRPTLNGHGEGMAVAVPGRSSRPRALVTLGTTVEDKDALASMVSAVDAAGFDVLVTADAADLPAAAGAQGVHALGFVPLAKLLPEVDLVVSAGGTGTVLAALTAGLPLVLRPFLADHPLNAARIAAQGAAIVIDDPADAGGAARRVWDSDGHRTAATAAAKGISTMSSPEHVVEQLIGLARKG
ncbi:glycosyltransferase [Umezawaea tangerina]|uniref:UDP:flavonoid glycosyltransferase YjiC (YdhE family) n=1 Tax=Umezawaea tangerina TaxID=84725 RepID=A0A2T0T792_9PSEU|nr:nucleotide disphospho-sugar-binding domain-containing protein [Umezawaea tangerina]PRY41540.1 UDP:flavonoid glycosyltransferase YjiC (YdhE family) [Umezawaea tangerina]